MSTLISPTLRHPALWFKRFTSLRLPGWLTSLRGGFTLFVVLFVLLQCASILLLTQQVQDARENVASTRHLREKLALLDKARMALLVASDNGHRAGIYLMQDQQSGSVDSWKGLATAASQSLIEAKALYARYQAPGDTPLTQSFRLLTDGLQEQLDGLNAGNSDSFFMVPMQAFQQQFNEAWGQETARANALLSAASSGTADSLTHSRNLSLALTGLLCLFLLAGGILLLQGAIMPLQQAVRQLQRIATGDLSPLPAGRRYQSRETAHLWRAMCDMQQGLQHIVMEINAISVVVMAGAEEMSAHNDALNTQHQQQNAAFSDLSRRLKRVAEEVENGASVSRQATCQAQSADDLTRRGGQMVEDVGQQMQKIVSAAGEIAGIVEMLDNLSLQTRLLALNAGIESAHAGIYGRSFSVVAREIRALSDKSGSSTRQIDQLIQNTRQHVDEGFTRVQSLDGLFSQITAAVAAAVTQMDQLQHNAVAQSDRVGNIARQVATLDEQVQHNEESGTRSYQAALRMREQAERLARSVRQFHIEPSQP